MNQQPFCDRSINTKVELQLEDLTQAKKAIGISAGPEGDADSSCDDIATLSALLCDAGLPTDK